MVYELGAELASKWTAMYVLGWRLKPVVTSSYSLCVKWKVKFFSLSLKKCSKVISFEHLDKNRNGNILSGEILILRVENTKLRILFAKSDNWNLIDKVDINEN